MTDAMASKESTPNTNIVLRMMAAMGEGGNSSHHLPTDQTEIAQYLDPDITVTQQRGLPYGGDYHGVAGFIETSSVLNRAFEVRVAEMTLYDTGDFVVLRAAVTMTGRGSGKTATMPFVELFWVRGNKIYRIEPYLDTATVCALYEGEDRERTRTTGDAEPRSRAGTTF